LSFNAFGRIIKAKAEASRYPGGVPVNMDPTILHARNKKKGTIKVTPRVKRIKKARHLSRKHA